MRAGTVSLGGAVKDDRENKQPPYREMCTCNSEHQAGVPSLPIRKMVAVGIDPKTFKELASPFPSFLLLLFPTTNYNL